MNLQELEVLRPPPSKAIFARRDASIVLEPQVEGFKEGSIKVEGFKGGSMRDCRGIGGPGFKYWYLAQG